jgi:hypothetical protein
MRDSEGDGEVQQVLNDRGRVYGETWKVTGEALKFIGPHLNRLFESGLAYPWFMIFAKLMRLLASPDHLDSWRDIVGYATLVVKDKTNDVSSK